MSQVIKRPQAERDLEESFVFIGEHNLDAALDFLTAAEETFLQLAQFPKLGKVTKFKNQFLATIRQFPVKGFDNHLIFYRSIPNGIEVVRVLHSRRDLDHLL